MASIPAPERVAATRAANVGKARNSRRASRSGGGTRMTVSLIGDGLAGAASVVVVRAGGLTVPVVTGSAAPDRVVARDSKVAWRRIS